MTDAWLPGPDEHEHQFVEEQESSGRLVLAPCLTCGLTAADAIAAASSRFVQINAFVEMVEESVSADDPSVSWVAEWLTLLLDGAELCDIVSRGEAGTR